MSENVFFKTKFWRDRDIQKNFTPEDRYFYIWCLTNEHIDILGHAEISEIDIARELGYSERDQAGVVVSLLNRFQDYHKLILYDYQTGELYIRNWHKYNWNSSPVVAKMIEKVIPKVHSEIILGQAYTAILEAHISISESCLTDIKYRLPIESQEGIDTPISISIDTKDDKDIEKIQQKKELANYVDTCFETTWKSCVRKEGKEQARKTYATKMKICKTMDEVKKKAGKIYVLYSQSIKLWEEQETEKQYIPMFSTWLNANVPDKDK